ncbi:3-oxoacyl-ACP synthase [Alkalilimnicola ehrlichii]|nr:3-oxoacyl-ACP synthase [Alkalilimnicola ehrlichii]
MVNTSDQWIRERSGIQERRIAAEGETCGDLAAMAAERAIASAGIDPAEIDLLVLATSTPDAALPSTACLIQRRIGMRAGSCAFDVSAACSGFVYALSIADQFLRSGAAKRALVVGAETMSRVLNWKDRTTCVLFGDGAGAVVLEAGEEPGIINTHLHADGEYSRLLHTEWGTSHGIEKLIAAPELAAISMNGSEVFKVAVRTLGRIVNETLAANDLDKNDIDWLIPHQANIRIIGATAKMLDMPMEKVVVTLQKQGNTSAASIPLALDTAVRDGRVKAGDLLLMEAFGGGFTWGSALVRF